MMDGVQNQALQDEIDALIKRYMDDCRWLEYSADRLTREGAALYVTQHGVFTRHSRRCWAYVVGQCPEVDVRRFIVRENLYEEEGIEEQSHYLTLVRMGESVGLTADDVHGARALPSTRGALLMWETLTKDRHWILGCAAKAALEQTNQPQCGEMSKIEGHRWMDKLGLTREDVDFWLMHDEIDQRHGSGAYDSALKFLPLYPSVSEQDVLDAVEDSMVAFRLFLDGIADEADARAAA